MAEALDVLESTTQLFTANLVDETGAAVGSTSLGTFKLSLYDAASSVIINSRSSQNVLNANGVTVSTTGGVSWPMDPADNIIRDTSLAVELHFALWQWTWGTASSKAGKHLTGFNVTNLALTT